MLRFLRVRHLAVIDSIEVEFDRGLNVLTGETGAGKSILVEAVGLLLGGRASGDLVRTGEELAAVEAIFDSGGEELLVRREVTAQGRSRAFVNGALATAGALKELSSRLIELHGQHEHQTLLDPATHLAVLDAYGGLAPLVDGAAAAFGAMSAAADELARFRRSVTDREARQELAVFQLNELERAAIEPGEDEALTATRQVLASAERVERLCRESYAALYESDAAVLASLGGVWRRVSELAALDPQFGGYLEARDGIKSQLEDLSQFLRRYADGIEASPARLQQVEERLALLERLKRKHGPALADVIARRDALRREVMEHDRGEERIAELAQAHAAARDGYLQAARALSDARRRVSSDFSSRLEQLLGELAMERTRFEVRFLGTLPESEWGPRGTDEATFFVSPNPGEDLRPLARIVSGGELSRIMLAIKTLSATTRHRRDAALESATHGASREPSDWRQEETPLSRPHSMAPGLIFDEVDAGIGGRVADVVGRRLHALGAAFQVLCITHLPQIAACADTHFSIEKRIEDGRTRTTVSKLDAAGRVEEIGRMLGGAAVTDGIRASAREMITARHAGTGAGGEAKAKAKGESERAKGA